MTNGWARCPEAGTRGMTRVACSPAHLRRLHESLPVSAPTVVCRASCVDLDQLVPLFDAFRQFHEQPADLARAEEFLQARLEREESVIFLARQGQVAVGYTQLYPLFSSMRAAPIWLLNDLFVTPVARGSGAAPALLKAAESFARESGAASMVLSTCASNTTAQSLFARSGWVCDPDAREYGVTFRV